MVRDEIKHAVSVAAREIFSGIAIPDFSVEVPENQEHGDYAVNIAMLLAKTVKKPPMEIAADIKKQISNIKNDVFQKIEIAAPGFINFTLSNDVLLGALDGVLKNPEGWGKSDVGKGKTAVVEYFQLNIAKRPHIGHIRSAVIGDAIKRMLLQFSYNAVSDTHVGDWGTQFGILIWAFRNLITEEDKTMYKQYPFENLEKLYQAANLQILSNPELRERGKEEFAKLEQGDSENRKIWQWMVGVSMKKLEESARRLGLLEFDEHRGESAYEDAMPEIVEAALQKGVAKKADGGAVVADLSDKKLDEAVLIKSDGASTYLLRDLATIQYRKKKWVFWKNLYVVDVRQEHHFRQVFRVAELLGFEGVGESQHVEFGFMSLPEGAMSTRQGTAIFLDAVLDEAKRRALAVIKEKNSDLQNAEKVAEVAGIGALKYFDLSHHRKSDIVFKWDEALSFEGNTGPYLQYTHARLKSILRKADESSRGARKEKYELDEMEHGLLVSLLRLPEAIEDALVDFTPNTLANYLFSFAKRVNEFYHSHPVLKEADEIKLRLRLLLVAAAAITLKNGLWCLGIEAPEEM